MARVVRTLTVYFYVADPQQPELTFQAGAYPLESVLEHIRALDPAAEDYRIDDHMFGGEFLCLLHDDGPQPLLGIYYKDKLHIPITEYKGQVEHLVLRDGEGVVDASYAMFFPGDVVGLVRTSAKSPGYARLGKWLSVKTPHPVYLSPLVDESPLKQLNRAPSGLQRFLLLVRRDKIPLVDEASPSVARALRAAADVNSHSTSVGVELVARTKDERPAFSQALRAQIDELVELLPDVEAAKVKVHGVKREVNLKRLRITATVELPLVNRKHIIPSDAAEALFRGYEQEQHSIQAAVAAWRLSHETATSNGH